MKIFRTVLEELYYIHHCGTIRWWIDNGTKENPEVITAYFLQLYKTNKDQRLSISPPLYVIRKLVLHLQLLWL